MTKCRTPNCLRKPEFPDQAFCKIHRLPWVNIKPAASTWQPAWLRNLRAKELAT